MMKVGYVLSQSGEYTPERLHVCLLKGSYLYKSQYVCISHPRLPDTRVYYQVEENPTIRPTHAYDVDEAKLDRPDVDEKKVFFMARALQIGFEDQNGEIMPLLDQINPLSPVYALADEEAAHLLTPRTNAYIEVAHIYPSLKEPVRLDLAKLLRQGCLVTGGVGTGKTTSLLTLVHSTLSANYDSHFLIIDWDGEFSIPGLVALANGRRGYVKLGVEEAKVRVVRNLTAREFFKTCMDLSGEPPQSRRSKALYAVLKQAEAGGARKFTWSKDVFIEIISELEVEETKSFWLERGSIMFPSEDESIDVASLIASKSIVHIDCSQSDWNTTVRNVSNILAAVYERAKSDPSFGCIVVIDEVHFFAPQSTHEAPASKDLYEAALLPVMKMLSTTGPRNGLPLFIATQRLSEVDKTVSTQMGQNIIAHQVEDVDLERLKAIMGPIAESARLLPRGYAMIKSSALRIRRPLIARIKRTLDPASVGKDLLSRWADSSVGT